jgi:hypothetical protein
MKFSLLQKKKPFVINTKIIIKVNNENYSLQKSSLPIDNILSITRQNKKIGKYIAYTKIKLFNNKTIYLPKTLETIIKNNCKKSKTSQNKNFKNKNARILISTKFILPKKNKPYCLKTDGKYCLTDSTRNTQIIRSITRQDKKFGKYVAYTKIIRNTKTFAFGRLRKTFYSPDTLEDLIKNAIISYLEK